MAPIDEPDAKRARERGNALNASPEEKPARAKAPKTLVRAYRAAIRRGLV